MKTDQSDTSELREKIRTILRSELLGFEYHARMINRLVALHEADRTQLLERVLTEIDKLTPRSIVGNGTYVDYRLSKDQVTAAIEKVYRF